MNIVLVLAVILVTMLILLSLVALVRRRWLRDNLLHATCA